MEENNEKEIVNDYSLQAEFEKEIMKNAKKELSKEEIEKLTEEAMVSINFLEKLEEIQIPSDKYVVFTDGEEQLYYENGEFYVISTTDSKKERKKKTKKEATDMYLDFFIKYQLNPILDQRNIDKSTPERDQKEKANLAKELIAKEAAQEQQKSQKEQQKQLNKDERSL